MGRSSGKKGKPSAGQEQQGRPPTHSLTESSTAGEEDDDESFKQIERNAREALEKIGMKDSDAAERLPEYIQTLRVYRRECARRSMFKEAHLVHQVLRNLRLEEEAQHIRGLTKHQMEERRRLEEGHRLEFRQFHSRWNDIIDHFEEVQLDEEIKVLEQQNEELLAFHEEMRKFNPRVGRYSKSLVESRVKQHTLAKQHQYAKALELKAMADRQETADLEKFESTRNMMYARRERALHRRHEQSLSALRNRVASRRNFLERARKKELDEMLQRYINTRRELETHQNIIRSKTGTILLKHACNTKSETSGSSAIVQSAESGALGATIRQRTLEFQQRQAQKCIMNEDEEDEAFDEYFEDLYDETDASEKGSS